MEVMQLDDLSLGAGLIVQADVKEQELHPTRQQETPSRSINGGVAMETEAEETRKKKEERWRKLFPEIKKCVIVIARQRLNKPEERREEEEEEEEEEGGGKSADPEPACDWMKPLELDDVSDKSKRFVKKVEVKVSSNNRRCRGDVLRLRHGDVITDPAHHRRPRDVITKNIFSVTEHNYSAPPVREEDTPKSQSEDSSLSLSCEQEVRDSCWTEKKNPPSIVFKKVEGDQWVLRSKVKKEKEEEEKKEDKGGGGGASQPEEKKKKKKKKEQKKEDEEEEEEEVEKEVEKKQSSWKQRKAKRSQSQKEDEWTPEQMKVSSAPVALIDVSSGKSKKQKSDNAIAGAHERPKMKTMMKENSLRKTSMLVQQRVRRRITCNSCTACLREDCGKCVHCLDKRKFGGPAKKKQRCQLRVCMVLFGKKKEKEKERKGEKGWTHPKKKNKEENEEKEEEKKKQRLWDRRKAKRRQSEEDEFSPELLKELEKVEKKMKEEAQKKEAQTPQFPALEAEELLNGTHIELNLTLDGSHFDPSILSDSDFSNLSALLPEEGSVLHMSTGLTYIPPPPAPPSLHPLPLRKPKEEEEAVDIGEHERTGGRGRAEDGVMEEEEEEEEEERAAGQIKEEEEWMTENEKECREGVTEEGKYYDIMVELPGFESEEETLTTSSTGSQVTDDVTAKVTDDVTAKVMDDVTAKVSDDVTALDPPELISLSSGPVSQLGGSGSSGEVTNGRGLSRLLRELRRTVLPAHWVAVEADGPLLQLLQCSRLSSMLATIIHIQPDLCFFITVENQLLPDTHTLYRTHTHRITHLSQLVSLLLELERLVVCRGSRVRCCHLLVAPPCFTCLPCLIGGEEEEDEDEDEDVDDDEEDDDEDDDEEEEEDEEASADETP